MIDAETAEKLIDDFRAGLPVNAKCNQWLWSGSTAINGVGSDVDLVMRADLDGHLEEHLIRTGFLPCCEEHYADSTFRAYRNAAGLNVIVVPGQHDFDMWCIATDVAVWLAERNRDMRNKDDRVVLFKLVREGA